MTTATAPVTLACFGATGGCTSAFLTQALKEGYRATALARTPSKLTNLLKSNGVDERMLENLTIIQGSISDADAIARTLRSPVDPNFLVDIIVSGIGSYPKWQLSIRRPFTIEQPDVCKQATEGVLAALHQLAETTTEQPAKATSTGQKPLYLSISTTGISHRQRDVPLLFVPLYHWMLAVPHEDKVAMEKILTEAPSTAKASASPVIRDFVVVRASLLLDGPRKGVDAIRAGWELPPNVSEKSGSGSSSSKAPGPALGYTIRRADVGHWMMEKIVKGKGEWDGKMVTITY